MLMAFVQLISSISPSIFTLMCLQSSTFSLGSKLFLYLTHDRKTSDAKQQPHLCLGGFGWRKLRARGLEPERGKEEACGSHSNPGWRIGWRALAPRLPFLSLNQAAVSAKILLHICMCSATSSLAEGNERESPRSV